MKEILLFLLFILCIWLLLFTGCCLYWSIFSPRSKANFVKSPSDCRLVISAQDFKKKRNQLTPFQSRAKHNEKLRTVFGIENSFTTDDPEFSNLFANVTRSLLLLQPARWEDLSVNISDNIRRWLDAPTPSSSYKLHVPLKAMVQSLTLRFIFLSIFSTHQPALDVQDAALVELVDAINCTWDAAKRGCNVPAFKDNAYLQEALSSIFHFDPSDERNNPLSLILPGYETIWRVVLRMVLQLDFYRDPSQLRWTKTLMDFAENPNRTQFMSAGLSFLVSAEDLVNETLRLYPPTRRIYRSFQQDGQTETTTYAADVEGCHLDTRIWGSDAALFNPVRWRTLTKAQEAAFFPFGTNPFLCPARPSFGPRAIGLLAGLILRELRNEWTLSEGSDALKIPVFKGRLSNERSAYGDLFLVKDDA